jgi:hypothetical protein
MRHAKRKSWEAGDTPETQRIDHASQPCQAQEAHGDAQLRGDLDNQRHFTGAGVGSPRSMTLAKATRETRMIPHSASWQRHRT